MTGETTPAARVRAREDLDSASLRAYRMRPTGSPNALPGRAAFDAVVRLQKAVVAGKVAGVDDDQRQRLGEAYRVVAEIAILEAADML